MRALRLVRAPFSGLFAACSLAVAGVALPSATEAQDPAPPSAAPASAAAVGTAFDSLHLRALEGAVVRLDSSALTTTTDGEGRFRLDVPAGEHYLQVEHPMLDTLGIILRSPLSAYVAGTPRIVELAVPAPETLIGIFCSGAWRARGPAALVGRVREADTGKPATGATVSLVWYEIDVAGGLRREPRLRRGTVRADGTYRICGLPAQLDGRVQVIRGSLTSGDIPVTFGNDLLGLRSMSIAAPGAVVSVTSAPPSDSAGTEAARPTVHVVGDAVLTGRVLNKAGQPLVGARILVEGTTRAGATRANGEFSLDSLPPGTQTVSVRLLGYTPTEQAVDLSSRKPASVTVILEDFVPVLETVRVSAQRERALDDVGFSRRQRMGQGYYMDAEEIQRRQAINFSDVVRNVPGIRIVQSMGRQMITSTRDAVNGCVNVWLDGTMWQQLSPGDVDDFVKPWELGAIEVYNGSSTPVEFQQAGRGSCTTIIAWTTRRLDLRR